MWGFFVFYYFYKGFTRVSILFCIILSSNLLTALRLFGCTIISSGIPFYKKQKAIITDQAEELNRLTVNNQALKEKTIKLRTISSENQLKNIILVTAGLFVGFF